MIASGRLTLQTFQSMHMLIFVPSTYTCFSAFFLWESIVQYVRHGDLLFCDSPAYFSPSSAGGSQTRMLHAATLLMQKICLSSFPPLLSLFSVVSFPFSRFFSSSPRSPTYSSLSHLLMPLPATSLQFLCPLGFDSCGFFVLPSPFLLLSSSGVT